MKGGEACNTRLSLGLCSPRPVEKQQQQAKLQPKPPVLFNVLFPPKLKEEVVMDDSDRSSLKAAIDESELDPKKNKTNTRKKQRLTKEQTTLLEDCFKEHPTLIPTQKLELAKQLKLRPRQVEVWFQNRRARNKFKQTEVDCEFLKKCCERLSDENGILKKELQELRSMPFYIQLCKVETLKICPSCEMVERTADGKNGIGALDVVAKKGSNKLFTGMDEYDGTIAL